MQTLRKLWHDYSLGIVLFLLFAVSWAGQYVYQVRLLGEDTNQFWASTTENWQSEFLQLLTFVILSKYFRYRGSPQSKE
jgi:drug/metabolite transporter (DMT)-like permease